MVEVGKNQIPCDSNNVRWESSADTMTEQPLNESVLGYSPGSPERNSIIQEIDRQMSETIEIPCIINGEEVFTGHTIPQVIPHNHGHILANVHLAGREEMESAWISKNEMQIESPNIEQKKQTVKLVFSTKKKDKGLSVLEVDRGKK